MCFRTAGMEERCPKSRQLHAVKVARERDTVVGCGAGEGRRAHLHRGTAEPRGVGICWLNRQKQLQQASGLRASAEGRRREAGLHSNATQREESSR